MLTILTEPVDFIYNTRNVIYPLIGKEGRYGGHPVRTERTIEGLQAIGFTDFNYRPRFEKDIGEHVHVMANPKTLKYAINLKREGRIKKLTAGPNIVVFPSEYDGLIADSLIDLYLQPSQWAADLHMQLEPRLRGRCIAYPYGGVGIDVNKYKPGNRNRRGNLIVYKKLKDSQLSYHAAYIAREKGYKVRIIESGKHKFEEYISLLDEAEIMVTVGCPEASGNYLTEAWAMDVPTICYDPHYYHWGEPWYFEYEGNVSTCPYLTEATGVRFSEIQELRMILEAVETYKKQWHPRRWVLENMTLEKCARYFLEAIGIEYHEK